MRTRDVNRKLFHTGHYEIIAARFRETLAPIMDAESSIPPEYRATSRVVTDLAINLAKRFALDNDEFNPVMFLNRCSPDPVVYPLGKLWEGVNQVEHTED